MIRLLVLSFILSPMSFSQTKKRSKRAVRAAAYSDDAEGDRYQYRSLKRGKKRRVKRKFYRNDGLRASMGVLSGYKWLDKNPLVLGIDYHYQVGNGYIPIGFSTWEGTVLGFARVGMDTVDVGYGHHIGLGKKGSFSLGARGGYARLNITVFDYNKSYHGYNITPFLGLNYSPARNLSLGYEARAPYVHFNIPEEDEEEDEDEEENEDDVDEEESDDSIPIKHLLNITFYF